MYTVPRSTMIYSDFWGSNLQSHQLNSRAAAPFMPFFMQFRRLCATPHVARQCLGMFGESQTWMVGPSMAVRAVETSRFHRKLKRFRKTWAKNAAKNAEQRRRRLGTRRGYLLYIAVIYIIYIIYIYYSLAITWPIYHLSKWGYNWCTY